MPAHVLRNDDGTTVNSENTFPEITSQHQRYILGAKLEHTDFQFIPRDDIQTFAALPEGAFFTDTDDAGLNWVGRKINGKRKYLAYDDNIKTYITDEVAKLYPVAVRAGESLPTSTTDKPLFEGRRIVFLSTGTVNGREVTAGATATVSRTIPSGGAVTWDDLLYNEAEQLEITPINLRDVIRRDGSASSTEGATEGAIHRALNDSEQQLNSTIIEVNDRLTSQVQNVSNSVSSLEIEQEEQNQRLENLESAPQWLEEFIKIGDGVNQVIIKNLSNLYINTPIVTWFILMGSRYVAINSQDIDFIMENNMQKIACAFAGTPATNQFKVSIQGLATPNSSNTPISM